MRILLTLLVMICAPILVQPFDIDTVHKAIRIAQNTDFSPEKSDLRISKGVLQKSSLIPYNNGFVEDRRPRKFKTSSAQRDWFKKLKQRNNLLNSIIQAISANSNGKIKKNIILLAARTDKEIPSHDMEINTLNSETEEDNTAVEILDESQENSSRQTRDLRRKNYEIKSKYRDRKDMYSSESDSSKDDDDESVSLEYEKNPGNPYTVKHNKYKQNWIWNHFMDGDHMNINPFGPKLYNGGPSGRDIFFNRKWWYFNQDDYKPLG